MKIDRLRRVVAVLSCALAVVVAPAGRASAAEHAQIEGSGSSWAANAVNDWIANVTSAGLRVVYTSTGSASGRRDFANGTTDFGVTDIGYQGVDPVSGIADTPCDQSAPDDCRAFAYVPFVAGGLSFPYHLEVGGTSVRNLRLSGATLAKIFTGAITNWDDAAITADNHGRRFPSLAITPVTHLEGSGASAHFSDYLDRQYPDIYRPFVGASGSTLYLPAPANGTAVAGSDGVINYVTSAQGNGSIAFDEYSYALARNTPVAEVENASQHFTAPTQFNVAVALRHAVIDSDTSSPQYGLADLGGVYAAPESAAYPLSYYSYLLMPTAADDPRMNTAKRQTLANFLFYTACDGQSQVGPIGYGALPLGPTSAALHALDLLEEADPSLDLTNYTVANCHNPTFVGGPPPRDTLSPPAPPLCDSPGWGPCGYGTTSVAISRSSVLAYGRTTTLSCTLRSGAGTVADRLRFEQAAAGTSAWHAVTTKATPADGIARLTVRPNRSTSYRCVNPTTGYFSPAATVGVRKVVTAHAHSVRSRVRIGGTVSPVVVGQHVQVQERVRGRWATIGGTTVGKHGYSYVFTTKHKGRISLRAVCAPTVATLAGTSPTVVVPVS